MFDKFTKLFKLTNKPYADTFRGWRQWHATTKKAEPIAYFFNETIPDVVDHYIKNITRPLNNFRYGIRVRVFDRYHVINTGLKPGYADCDTRMLNGMFNMLVDFVEVEKAWMNAVFSKENKAKYTFPWWSLGWTRFKGFRCQQAGLDYLDWEITLGSINPDAQDYDPQAYAANEVKELYNWWKNIRPNRPDAMDASGWSLICDKRRKSGDNSLEDLFEPLNETEEDKAEAKIAINTMAAIEKLYNDEDTEMLIRLIKIRTHLWT